MDCQLLKAQNFSRPSAILQELKKNLANQEMDDSQRLYLYGTCINRLTNRGNYHEADSVYQSVPSHLFQNSQDSLYIAEIDKTVAFMNRVRGRYSKSLEGYLGLLKYYNSLNNLDQIALSYSFLGEFHRARRKYEPAEKYLAQAKTIIDQGSVSKSTQAYWFSRKAAIQNERDENRDSTLYYASRGLELATDDDAYYTKALLLNEIAYTWAHIDNFSGEKIIDYYNQSISILLRNERYLDFLFVNNNLALYYMKIGAFDMALPLLRKPLKMAEKNDWNMGLESNYRRLSQTFSALGQKDSSYIYSEKSYEAQLVNLANKSAIAVEELTATYDKNIAEENLKKQQLATLMAEEGARKNRNALIITIIVSVVMLGLALLSFELFRRNRKKTIVLSEQQDIIKESNTQLTAALNQTKVLYRELNHRVKNNLSVLSSLIYLQESGENNISQKEVYQTLRHRIQSIALVHENLYAHNEVLKIDFQVYIEQLITNVANALDMGKSIGYNINCKGLMVEMDEAVPLAIIINELMTNSLKHAFNDKGSGEIELTFDLIGSQRVLHYKDNGTGLINIESNSDPKSLGMRLVKLLCQQMKGNLTYLGDQNGAYFRIEFGEKH
jgi:two-component sensor histidine kinase